MSRIPSDNPEITPDHGPAVVSLADARARVELKASLKKMARELARQHAYEDHMAAMKDRNL